MGNKLEDSEMIKIPHDKPRHDKTNRFHDACVESVSCLETLRRVNNAVCYELSHLCALYKWCIKILTSIQKKNAISNEF